MAPDVVWETLANVNGPNCRFIKTVDSDKRPGEKLDVYDALVDSQPIYVKIKITKTHDSSKILVVLSFKKNEYYDRNVC
jgi:hypothetical protein